MLVRANSKYIYGRKNLPPQSKQHNKFPYANDENKIRRTNEIITVLICTQYATAIAARLTELTK